MKFKIFAAMCLILAIASTAGCYKEIVARDFTKPGEQSLDGWHLLPFADVQFTKEGLAIGRVTFSVPVEFGSEFSMKIDLQTDLEGEDLDEMGICLSEEKVYLSPLGRNVIIRTQSKGGSATYEAYSVNFVVKEKSYASGNELLPGFKLDGKNSITVWKKGIEFGWDVNGKKSEKYELPTQLAAGVYVHFNFNAGSSGSGGMTISKIRASGPDGSASAW